MAIPPARYLYVVAAVVLLLVSFTAFKSESSGRLVEKLLPNASKPTDSPPTDQTPPTPSIVYKPKPTTTPNPITDNFPLAAKAKSPSDLPPIPSYNVPPTQHVPEKTPLLIGFTRNWPLLQQTIVGYITAGWPPADIHVIDNTGTMNSNELGNLTLQNPFYLDYYRLTKVFGVRVQRTPTLLTFAQLQNFYMHLALENSWDQYFWGHMDVAVLPDEEWNDGNDGKYKSLYMRAVDVLRESTATDFGDWAIRFCSYDYLALVNLKAFMAVGGWDATIGYYMTDCDMHSRLAMHGFKSPVADAGFVYDVGTSPKDMLSYYRRKSTEPGKNWGDEDGRGSEGYKTFRAELEEMQKDKKTGKSGRNHWHTSQSGGKGEPFYVDPVGFQGTFERAVTCGREMFNYKWGYDDCRLREAGLKEDDRYQVEKVIGAP